MVVFSYFVHHKTVLQFAKDIFTNHDNYLITKCDKGLLQNLSAFLKQNATVLLQSVSVQRGSALTFIF